MKHFIHWFNVLAWPDRYACHASARCCQAVDGPDCHPV